MKEALLLIDIQNDYFPGGKFELYKSLGAAENAKKVLDKCRRNGMDVIYIQHTDMNPDAGFFANGSQGAEIHESVSPLSGEPVFVKHVPSSFLGTGLADYISENAVTDLVVCGMMSHMCVDTTVRACMDFGLKVTLIEDACTTRDLEFNGNKITAPIVHQTFMAALNGIFAKVITADDYINQ